MVMIFDDYDDKGADDAKVMLVFVFDLTSSCFQLSLYYRSRQYNI